VYVDVYPLETTQININPIIEDKLIFSQKNVIINRCWVNK